MLFLFARLDTFIPLVPHPHIRPSSHLDDWGYVRGATPPTGLSRFRRPHRLGTPQVMTPIPSPNWDIYLTPDALRLPQDASFDGAWHPALPVLGALRPPPARALEIHFMPSQVFDHNAL